MSEEEIKTYYKRRSIEEKDNEHPVYVKEHIQRRRASKTKSGIIEVVYPARWQKARGR